MGSKRVSEIGSGRVAGVYIRRTFAWLKGWLAVWLWIFF